MTNLTPAQLDVLRIVARSLAKRGAPPSIREIAATRGVASPHGIAVIINALVALNYLARAPGTARGLTIPVVATATRESAKRYLETLNESR